MTRPVDAADRGRYPVARGVAPPPSARRFGWPRLVMLTPLPCMFIGWFIFQGPGADAIRRLNYRVGENTPAGVAEPVPAARVGHESNPPGPQRTAPSLTTAASSPAAANGASPVVTFADVAALFAAKCNNCHTGDRPKGGLDLGSRASIVRGGISGPAVVAGKSGESVLWDSVESGSMPPGKARALTVREKQLIRDWIDGGAR